MTLTTGADVDRGTELREHLVRRHTVRFQGKMKRKRGAKTPTKAVEVLEGGSTEVYEVDSILDVKDEDSDEPLYEVKWSGYEETTWEPASNIPANLITAFMKRRGKQKMKSTPTVQADASSDRTEAFLCPTCSDAVDGSASRCERCKRPMHHFCAHDVCSKLELSDANGVAITEFPNDVCYCSIQCYKNRNRPMRPTTTTRYDDIESDSDLPIGRTRKPLRRYSSADEDEQYEYAASDLNTDWDAHGALAKQQRRAPRKKATSARKTTVAQVAPADQSKSLEKLPPKKKPPVVPSIVGSLIGKTVAFCAEHEEWMPDKDYKAVKDFFLSGRVFLAKKKVGESAHREKIYEIRWGYTQFQGKRYIHVVNEDTVRRGVRNFALLSGGVLSNASWRSMCSAQPDEQWEVDKSLDDYEIWDGSLRNFETRQLLPETLDDVEQLMNLDFQASRHMKEPKDLFKMDDGQTKTRVRKEHVERFARSASSSFFAYLPLSFWRKVVTESNAYAADEKAAALTIQELMKFLGILFYMTVVDKGEYSAYWGTQPEERIFGAGFGEGLERVMPLKRFQFIRKVLSFRHDVTPQDLKDDPAARIRPLMNMLKHTSPLYVEVGRDVAVDESSIACRSKYGRHLIVFNSSKPTGKFHFKIYTCCCSTSWLMVGFRLHCSSTMKARLGGVVSSQGASDLEKRLQFSSEIRKHVLEVTQSIHGTKRIVNTDNFYTSVQLLLSLKEVGLYGRGTVRENSKHFPKAHMFSKRSGEGRGSMMQGVSSSGKIVAASWMDGNAVNIISNADASVQTEVRRRVGQTSQVYPAPKCIAEYNQNMQGVDRMDQLRAQFSLADGHSFQKWHKKLGVAFIDLARCNAYVTRCLALGEQVTAARNPHRVFMIDLFSELISGEWADSCEEDGMFFDDPQSVQSDSLRSPVATQTRATRSPASPACDFVLSKVRFPNATRGKRGCKVCKFEGRYETEKTNYCSTHNVCLCTQAYATSERFAGVVCPFDDWTCWRKYHEYYLPKGLFNTNGRIKRASVLNKAKRQLALYEEVDALGRTPTLEPGPPVSTNTLNAASPASAVQGATAFSEQETTTLECYPATPSLSIPSRSPSSVFV